MPTLALNVTGIAPTGTPPAVITSGAAAPLTLRIMKAERKGGKFAPNWVETERPGKRPLMHIRSYNRPEWQVEAELWDNGRNVEPAFGQLFKHAQGVFGITISFGGHLSAHRWAVLDLASDVTQASPDDNSATQMTVTMTLKELTSESATTPGPLPGVPPTAVVTGPGPAVPSFREGKRRHTWADGDTLPRLAFSVYGDQAHWRNIAAANGIDDPRPQRIPVGSVLVLP